MKNKLIVIFIIAIIIIGGGSFYGGMKYGQSKSNGAPANFRNMTAAQRQQLFGSSQAWVAGGRANSGGFVNGQIIAKDDKSITVKTPDGGSKIIFLAGSTQISKSVSGAVADLNNGQEVMVNGTTNSDGSITANNIQIRPPLTASSTPLRGN